MIVIHWTGGSFNSAVNWLCNPAAQVSSHYVIDRTGFKIYKLVEHNRRAWHCNPSWHPNFLNQNISGLNSYSIGIECEGSPSVIKTNGWDESFVDNLIILCQKIKNEMPTIKGITDHSTISPQLGKSDVLGGVGIDKFPWNELVSGSGLIDEATPIIREQVRKHYGLKV
jgi:N-acetylmuramoyl-L-alanine amidase